MKSTNAIGMRLALFGVAQGSRTHIDGATLGFATETSYNRQEAVLSPGGPENVPPATVISMDVKSVMFLRISGGTGKALVRVTKEDDSYYEQVVDKIFMFSPDEPVTVTVQSASPHNINALVIWS